MKRRFNYTGRDKLTEERIKIRLHETDGKRKNLKAEFNFLEGKYPSTARIYLDAYHKTERKRFDFGTISNISQPEDLSIDELAYTDNLMFRLVVVDDIGQGGMIVAHADRIRTDDNLDKKSILPVSLEDIGYQPWRLEFKGNDHGPILCINNQIHTIENIAKKDSVFFMNVYPAVIKEILLQMVFVDGVENPNDPSIEWHHDWLEFSKKLLPNDSIPDSLDPSESESFDKEIVLNWIEKIVEEFCTSKKNEWDSYKLKMEGE